MTYRPPSGLLTELSRKEHCVRRVSSRISASPEGVIDLRVHSATRKMVSQRGLPVAALLLCSLLAVSFAQDCPANGGSGNTGCGNTGSGNIGNYNAGSGNMGNYNSGSGNHGTCNVGNGLTGTGITGIGSPAGCMTTCPVGTPNGLAGPGVSKSAPMTAPMAKAAPSAAPASG
ncbi:hypothetical protein WJX84_011051 [Apatococcus fuscideae]|uniref:Uncharacterized protein n=1 Tax=Apatococcus fuscideae TaxID=2026836 RepID=A0AAW1TLB3_9CHLO